MVIEDTYWRFLLYVAEFVSFLAISSPPSSLRSLFLSPICLSSCAVCAVSLGSLVRKQALLQLCFGVLTYWPKMGIGNPYPEAYQQELSRRPLELQCNMFESLQ